MNAPPSSDPGVLCAGSIVLDTIVREFTELRWGTTTFVETMDRHLGGNGANTARALAILGNRVRLAGAVGNDDAAAFALRELKRCDVDIEDLTHVDRPNAATIVLVNARGDRQFLHRLGSSNEVFGEPLRFTVALIKGMRHFHLASLFVLPNLRRHAPEMLVRAREAGLSTSLDANWDPHGEWLKVLEPCLPHIDLLFLNEDESRMLTGTTDPAKAASHLQARGANTVVQKLSHEGCAIYPRLHHPAVIRCFPYDVSAVDSTGAGDCFTAGFLFAFLRGASFAEAGDHGNAAGALSVQSIGAVTGLLPASHLEEWKRTTPRRGC